MNERILQKRLKRLGIAVAVISAAILAAGSLASFYLRNILGEALTGQMKSDADQYRTNILRQMDADLQTLDTLGSLLQYKDAESLIRRFGQTKGHNGDTICCLQQIEFFGKIHNMILSFCNRKVIIQSTAMFVIIIMNKR